MFLRSASLVMQISIHALREEGDRSRPSAVLWLEYFYPRPPRGGRLSQCSQSRRLGTFLSTPSARRATAVRRHRNAGPEISIHALREEGDQMGHILAALMPTFLSTPSARRATETYRYVAGYVTFLSTPSARRATARMPVRADALKDFYPRPPRGGRQHRQRQTVWRDIISIHALREEGDGGLFFLS